MATVNRKVHTQQVHYIAKQVTYSDSGISAGTLEFPARLPPNACIVFAHTWVKTAFNAATTNVLTVGTVSGTANDILTGGDVDETATVGTLTKGVGVISSTAEKQIFAKYTQTGAAASAGVAVITIGYIDLNNP